MSRELIFSEAEQAGGLSFSDQAYFSLINALGFWLPSKEDRINNQHFTAALDEREYRWRRIRGGTFEGYIYRDVDDGDLEFSFKPFKRWNRDGTLAVFAGQTAIAGLAAGETRYIWINWSNPATPTIGVGAAWPAVFIPHTRIEAIAAPASGPWLDQHRTRYSDAHTIAAIGEVFGNGSTKRAFAFDSASPLLIANVPAGCTVLRAKVRIDTPFNGAAPSLTVGDAGNTARLMAAADIKPTIADTYIAELAVDYGAATDVNIYITPGAGATTGAGLAILEYMP